VIGDTVKCDLNVNAAFDSSVWRPEHRAGVGNVTVRLYVDANQNGVLTAAIRSTAPTASR
jgi:hypothetical protein